MARMGMFLHDGIGPVLDYMMVHTATQVADAMQDGADQVQVYAQSNAPWSDITGRARSGLASSVYLDDGEVVLELAHGVDYGYWLEVIQEGRFAIIMPTLEALGPEILKQAGAEVKPGRGFF